MLKKNDIIQIEPEIIQLNLRDEENEPKQYLKIKNITANSISSIFFCLYNEQKFEISPTNFNLLPFEEKIITIKMKLYADSKSQKSNPKQFVYVKSAQINKRITIIINNEKDSYDYDFKKPYQMFESSAIVNLRRTSQELDHTDEQPNTMSDRAYRLNQDAAFEKIIVTKDEYISKLERQIDAKNDEIEKIQQQLNSTELQEQIQAYQIQLNKLLECLKERQMEVENQRKDINFLKISLDKSKRNEEEFRQLFQREKGLYNHLKEEIPLKYVQKEYYDALEREVDKRERKIMELEQFTTKSKEEVKIQYDKKLQGLNLKYQDQKRSYDQMFRSYQSKLRDLESIQQVNENFRNKCQMYEKQLIKKDEEIKFLKQQTQSFKKSLKDFDNERLLKVKFEIQNSRLSESYQTLLDKSKNYQKMLQNQKHEILSYKSNLEKIERDDKKSQIDKISLYYDMAMEASRNQNDMLKKSKQQLEKSILTYSKNEKLLKQKIDLLQKQLLRYQDYINEMKQKTQNLQKLESSCVQLQKQLIKQKQQNLNLMQREQHNNEEIQKISKKEQHQKIFKHQYQIEIQLLKKRFIHSEGQAVELQQKLKDRNQEIKLLNEKINFLQHQKLEFEKQNAKYKSNIKKELDYINNTAIEEMKKLAYQKKLLQRKIDSIEKSGNHGSQDQQPPSFLESNPMKQSKFSKPRNNTKDKDRSNKSIPPNNKLSSIEDQVTKMRQQLKNFKQEYSQNRQQKKQAGIRDQRKQLNESKINKSFSIMQNKTILQEDIQAQLAELRELQRILRSERQRFDFIFNLRLGKDNEQPVTRTIKFFRILEQKFKEYNEAKEDSKSRQRNTSKNYKKSWKEEQNQYKQTIQNLKVRIVYLQNQYQTNKQNNRQSLNMINTTNNKINQRQSLFQKSFSPQLLDVIQQEMRNQYKKLQETIGFCHQKYQILKKKIYGEYRSRIVQILNKKDKKELERLQTLLQRFIQSLSNVSHKQAVLSKEVKKKVQVRRQNKNLKLKINQLDSLLEQKKTTCTRDPVKVFLPKRQQDILYQSLKFESQLLSSNAQNQRLQEELSLLKDENTTLTSQLKKSVQTLEEKQDEILKLKSQILDIGNLHKQQISNTMKQLQNMKNQYLKVTQLEQQLSQFQQKEKQNYELKDAIQRKNQIIRSYKEKQRENTEMLEYYQKQKNQQKEKYRSKEESRMQDLILQLKEKNRELKIELEKRAENQRKLQDELEKKAAHINSIRVSNSTHKEKEKIEQKQLNLVSIENQNLKMQLRKVHEKHAELKNTQNKLQNSYDNLKSKLADTERNLSYAQNQLKSLSNQHLIKDKSLMSIIRGFIEIMRRLWRFVQIKVRKQNPHTQLVVFDELVKDPLKIDMIKMYEAFEDLLKKVKQFE